MVRSTGKAAPAGAAKSARIGSATERRLIDVATPLFTKMGYDRVSTRQIAAAAETTVPTIYLYFKDKRALYLRCCVDVFQNSSTLVREALESAGSPEERIFRIILAIARTLTEDPYVSKLFQRELVEADGEGLDLIDEVVFQGMLKQFRDIIDEAIGAPQPAFTAISVYALTFGLTQYLQLNEGIAGEPAPGEDKASMLAKNIMRVTLPTIYEAYCRRAG